MDQGESEQGEGGGRAATATLALVALTTALSAGLVFLVEPLVARLVLPGLGGSPAVWNTCMLFFQATLLCGYGLTHLTTRFCSRRLQLGIHALILFGALATLPFRWEGTPPSDQDPTLWLLASLALQVGAPFFALSTASPLLQRWVVGTDLPSASDPYVLYAASNVGSLGGLLAYPIVVEPLLSLSQQRTGVSVGYGVFAVLAVACGALCLRRVQPRAPTAVGGPEPSAVDGASPWAWIGLAALPSSLMLGVTQHLSTDVAAAPLLWVVPLALYLLSFVVAFSPRLRVPLTVWSKGYALGATALALAFLVEARSPIGVLVLMHLVAFWFACMLCHQRLADSRPPPERLTAFYLCLALGGVVGGSINALLAPMLFNTVLEYPIVLVAVCLVTQGHDGLSTRARRVTLAAAGALALWQLAVYAADPPELARLALRNAIPALAIYACSRVPRAMALAFAVCLATAGLTPQGHGRALLTERSFFGVVRVAPGRDGRFRVLLHGTTYHGQQAVDPADRDRPTLYYHPSGPIGRLMTGVAERPVPQQVGLVGLGVGSLAAYGREGDRYTYFEIDPVVARVASDPAFFTYLARSRAETRIVLGDGRLTLHEHPDGALDVLVLDAFSSDAIPVHLLTREAFALYRRKLRGEWVLAVHVSNRHVDLRPVLAAHAADSGFGAWEWGDVTTGLQREQGKEVSTWVALTPAPEVRPPGGGEWRRMRMRPTDPRWTDDYSNVFELLDWF